jgi:hypothetical protein
MSTKKFRKITVLIASLATCLVAASAQQNQTPAQTNPNQNQTQPNQAQPNQTQTNQTQTNQSQNSTQPQNQPTQPQQKKSFWQKMKDASQQGQNAIQQGTNTVQQGKGTVQQTGQQVQNGAQQIQNGAQQSVQQGTQSVQQGASGGAQSTQASGAFSGGGGGAGACGSSCFDAGPFQANVSQMTMSQEGGWHVIRMNIQFHNSTNQPLIVAYHDGSMVMIDNNGNTYVPAGGNPGELQGMGIDRGNQTDSQFVLAPGQTGNALFSVARGRGPTSPIGTGYTYNLTIDELQPQNGAMAIPVRTYNLNFPTLTPGTSNASFTSHPSPASGSVSGTAVSNARTPATTGTQSVPAQRGVAAPTQQQQMVNGRLVPARTSPTPVVNNAAMKTPVPAAKPQTTAPIAAKPSAATTSTTTAAPPKKAPSTTSTTTPTK